MKYLFRLIKIFIVSLLTIFIVSVTAAYLLLNIPSVQQKITRWGEDELSSLLGTRLTIGASHVFPFNKIELSDLCLYDNQGDTLLHAQRLIAGVALQELLQRRLVFTTVQLYDFEVSLQRETPDAPLNLQFILDRFKKEGTSAIDLHSQINTILARRGTLRYDVHSEAPRGAGLFDPNHVAVSDFLATVSLKSLERDSININIRKISFEEKSGFSLRKFGAKLIGNRENVVLSNFRITLPHTDILMEKTSTDLLSYDRPRDFFHNSNIDIQIQDSYITLSDLGAFVPRLKNVSTAMAIETHLRGTPDNLTGNLRINYGKGDLTLSAEASASHLARPGKTIFSGKIEELQASPTVLPRLLQEILPERPALAQRFTPMGHWQFEGEIDKSPDGLNANGTLSCELGEIQGHVGMDILAEGRIDVFTLDGELRTPDFEIGRFFAIEPLLGNVGLDIKLNLNQQTRGGSLWGRIEGNIDHVDFKGYTYHNIVLSGNYNDTNYDGIVSINDPNGKLHLIGMLDLFDARPVIRVFAEGQDIKLGELNLAPQYAQSTTSFNVTSNFYGDHIDNIEGEIVIDTLSFENEGETFSTGEFTVTAENNDSIKRLHITSDLINGGIEGNYSFKQLKEQFMGLLSRYLPGLPTGKADKKRKPSDGNNNFRYGFKVENSVELSSTLKLPVTLQEPMQISGFFDGESQKLGLRVDAPDLMFNTKHLYNNEVHIDSKDSLMSLALRTQTYNKKGQFTGISFDTDIKGNNILSRINWSNNGDTTFCGEISTCARLLDSDNTVGLHIDVLPTQVIIGDSIWQILPATIDIAEGKGRIGRIEVRHKEQYLHIDGTVSKEPSDMLNLSLNDLSLDYIFEALNLKNVVFGGQATGDIVVADLLNGTPRLSTKEFSVKDFSYNHAEFGDLHLFSRWDNENRGILLKGTVSQDGYPDTRVDGYIFPTRDSLNLHFDARHISLAFLNPFTEKILKDVDGHATGKINFYGRFKALNVKGSAYVDRFGFGIDYLNTRFYISDSIRLTPDAIIIDNMTLAGEDNHLGRVNGIMRHKNFKNIEYVLNASDINDMLVYNTTEKDNDVYYGKVYGSGSVSIEGNTQYTGIDINMMTNERSKFTFVLSDNAEAEEYQFITFVDRSRNPNKNTLQEERPRPIVLPETSSHLLSLNLQIDVNPQMSMNLLMDPATGDMIHATGSGNIRLEYNTFSDMKLYGTYTVDKGNYNFSLQDLITKDFIIKTGSSISFSGAPQNAGLNIEAYYALTANLEDLDESFATEPDLNRTTIPVRAMLYLTGNLQQPEFRFDLDFPTVTQDIDRRIRSIISSDDMVNRQIIYLLALNKFYTPDYMNVGQTNNNELVSVASSALSSQLNNLLGQINENINIGTNLRSEKGDFSDVEVEVALSSQLLNNRLIINGNIGYRDNDVNNNTFIGDFDLEYLLNKSGNIRLKAYNHYNDKNYYVKSALTTQGVGIMYRKEFNKWSEWFSWLRRRKNNTEKKTP